MADFVAAMDGEIAQLEAEVEADPRVRRLRLLKQLRIEYGGSAVTTTVYEAKMTPARVPGPTERPSRTPSPSRQAVVDAAVEVVRELESPFPVKTRDILQLLPPEVSETIPGKEPLSNLSALIHNSKRFVSHGRDGWTLPEQPRRLEGPNVAEPSDPPEKLMERMFS